MDGYMCPFVPSMEMLSDVVIVRLRTRNMKKCMHGRTDMCEPTRGEATEEKDNEKKQQAEAWASRDHCPPVLSTWKCGLEELVPGTL